MRTVTPEVDFEGAENGIDRWKITTMSGEIVYILIPAKENVDFDVEFQNGWVL